MRGTDWEVTEWGAAITESGLHEFTGMTIILAGPSCPKLRVYDDDNNLYAVIIARNDRAAAEAHFWMERNYGSTRSTIRRVGDTQYKPFI